MYMHAHLQALVLVYVYMYVYIDIYIYISWYRSRARACARARVRIYIYIRANARAHAYIYAKKNKYPFFINSSNWNYKSKDGWHDYFTSLNEYKDDGSPKDIKQFSHVKKHIHDKYKISDYIQVIKELGKCA